MRIISWNLNNVGTTKLTTEFSLPVAKAGVGNNVLDCIVKVAMGDAVWKSITAGPVDIFVLIELRCGGNAKGQAGSSGAALPVMTSLAAEMNKVATAAKIDGNYQYSQVAPLITGYHETVGIIFNNKVLTYVSSDVLKKKSDDQYLLPRTPFRAVFTAASVKGTPALSVVGVHAPTKLNDGVLYRAPIKFCREIADTTVFDPGATGGAQNAILAGDFNCNPEATYLSGEDMIEPFDLLLARKYAVNVLPTPAYSSLRTGLDNGEKPPLNYMSEAFDNILSRLPDVSKGQSPGLALATASQMPAPLHRRKR